MLVFIFKFFMCLRLLRSAASFSRCRCPQITKTTKILLPTQSFEVLSRRFNTAYMAHVPKNVPTNENDVMTSLNELSPMETESQPVVKDNSTALLLHLRNRITWALETWTTDENIDKATRNNIAIAVVDAILLNRKSEPIIGDSRQQNKMLVDYGSIVARALRATPGSLIELNNDITVLDKTILAYEKHLEKNRAVYININKHHESLVKKTYATAVSDTNSLEQYAEAAHLMGKKIWVQEGNMWMEEFSINFFRRNGARKSYLKSQNHDPSNFGEREIAEGLPRDLMLEETFINNKVNVNENKTGQDNSVKSNTADNTSTINVDDDNRLSKANSS